MGKGEREARKDERKLERQNLKANKKRPESRADKLEREEEVTYEPRDGIHEPVKVERGIRETIPRCSADRPVDAGPDADIRKMTNPVEMEIELFRAKEMYHQAEEMYNACADYWADVSLDQATNEFASTIRKVCVNAANRSDLPRDMESTFDLWCSEGILSMSDTDAVDTVIKGNYLPWPAALDATFDEDGDGTITIEELLRNAIPETELQHRDGHFTIKPDEHSSPAAPARVGGTEQYSPAPSAVVGGDEQYSSSAETTIVTGENDSEAVPVLAQELEEVGSESKISWPSEGEILEFVLLHFDTNSDADVSTNELKNGMRDLFRTKAELQSKLDEIETNESMFPGLAILFADRDWPDDPKVWNKYFKDHDRGDVFQDMIDECKDLKDAASNLFEWCDGAVS